MPDATPRAAPARSRRRTEDAPVEIAGVRLTHPERVLWADQGITKRALAEHWLGVADLALPHLAGRPLTLIRCPSGGESRCFVQRHAWAGLHEAVHRAAVTVRGQEQEVLSVDSPAGLVALVQAGVLELHGWGTTLADPTRPDQLVLDLDPGEGIGWGDLVAAAREVRERLDAAGLVGFVKTSGGKGLHVVAPLAPSADWTAAKVFAKRIAAAMAGDAPDRYTVTAVKAEREGRIYIDYLRNALSASAVASYSPRARPGAPVSTPLSWEELSARTTPDRFTVESLPRRLKRVGGEPWAGFEEARRPLPASVRKSRRSGPA